MNPYREAMYTIIWVGGIIILMFVVIGLHFKKTEDQREATCLERWKDVGARYSRDTGCLVRVRPGVYVPEEFISFYPYQDRNMESNNER